MNPFAESHLEDALPCRAWKSVEEREFRDLDRDAFVRDFERPNRPVLIKGARFWGGEEPFSPALLQRLHGDVALGNLKNVAGGTVGVNPRHIATTPTLGDYLARWDEDTGRRIDAARPYESSAGLPYLTNMSLPHNFPRIDEQFSASSEESVGEPRRHR